jgi:hypothetical protein
MGKARQGFIHGFRSAEAKDEWLTPVEIIHALGDFDLDPCSPINRPWDTAATHYTIDDDGLYQPWKGRVWLNPPYGDETGLWMQRLLEHGNGVALVFARTETQWFFDSVWGGADAIFFFKGRIAFYHVDGTRGDASGAPSVLVAYGLQNVLAINRLNIPGHFIDLKR